MMFFISSNGQGTQKNVFLVGNTTPVVYEPMVAA